MSIPRAQLNTRADGVLQIEGRGLGLPQLTTAQVNALAASLGFQDRGILVEDISSNVCRLWNGTGWDILQASVSSMQALWLYDGRDTFGTEIAQGGVLDTGTIGCPDLTGYDQGCLRLRMILSPTFPTNVATTAYFLLYGGVASQFDPYWQTQQVGAFSTAGPTLQMTSMIVELTAYPGAQDWSYFITTTAGYASSGTDYTTLRSQSTIWIDYGAGGTIGTGGFFIVNDSNAGCPLYLSNAELYYLLP